MRTYLNNFGASLFSAAKKRVAELMGLARYWQLKALINAPDTVLTGARNAAEVMESGRMRADFLVSMGLARPDSVTLHIGCGLGRVEKHLTGKVKRCHGVDISSLMIKKAAKYAGDNAVFQAGNGRDLRIYDDASFDLVYSFLTFQHLPPPIFYGYLPEAHRALRSGGHFVFHIPINENQNPGALNRNHPSVIRRYKRGDVKKLLDQAGFTGVRVVDKHGKEDEGKVDMDDAIFLCEKA